MKLLLSMLFFIYSEQCMAQSVSSPPNNPDVVCWCEGVKLGWKDFKAKTHPDNDLLAKDFVSGACCAPRVTILPYKDSYGKPNFLVESFLLKKESWVRDSSSIISEVLLAHEQLHFDINELFARKIRRKVAECYLAGGKVYGPELGSEIQCLLLEKNEFQEAFDHEAHSDNSVRMLQKWQAIVARDLAALKAYKSTIVNCSQ